MSDEKLENGLIDALSLPMDVYGGTLAGNPLLSPQELYNNISQNLLSLQPVLLNYSYKTYGFIQTAVDQPIDDAFRNGVGIDSATMEIEELEELKQSMEDNGDFEEIKRALKWARLFGGGVLIANTEQNADSILSEKRLYNRKLEFYASDRWETICATPDKSSQESDYIYYGKTINNSRVYPVFGKYAPYYVRMRLQGWGMSMLEQTLPPLVTYLKGINVMLELLDESKIDVLKINGLATTLMQPNGTATIRKRVDTAAANKNYKSMITMDKEDEYEQKQLSFGGLPELSKEIRIMIASYLKLPVSKIFGVGSSGFSSGEDDLENYNAMVESEVRQQALGLLKWVIDLRCMQLFGRKAQDITIKWNPLRVLSAEQEQNITDRKVDNAMKLLNGGILTKRQVAQKLVKEDVLVLDNQEIERIEDEYAQIGEIKIDEFE